MLQYKIPQNVGIEDKIVGPLSLRQLLILAAGCGISYLLFAVLNKIYELNVLEYAVIALPALASAAAALIRINDMSFTRFLLTLMEFSIKPRRRMWDHRAVAPLVLVTMEEEKPEKTEAAAPAKKPVNLEALSRVLDSGGFEHVSAPSIRDIDEAKDDDLVTQAFFGTDSKEKIPMYWRTKESHKARLALMAAKQAEPVLVPASGGASTPEGISTARKRNKKPLPPPARPGTRVDSTVKNQPVSYVPHQRPAEPASPLSDAMNSLPEEKTPSSGEFEFKELQKGEIEINLD